MNKLVRVNDKSALIVLICDRIVNELGQTNIESTLFVDDYGNIFAYGRYVSSRPIAHMSGMQLFANWIYVRTFYCNNTCSQLCIYVHAIG